MIDLKVKKLSENAKLPERGSDEASGLDVFSTGDYYIDPMKDVLIPLDLSFDIPFGYDLSVYNKSGRSTKNKLIKGAELIDSDYTGCVHVHLFNISDKPVKINKGEKIAQLVLRPVLHPNIVEVEEIEKITIRASGGFGSTGV